MDTEVEAFQYPDVIKPDERPETAYGVTFPDGTHLTLRRDEIRLLADDERCACGHLYLLHDVQQCMVGASSCTACWDS